MAGILRTCSREILANLLMGVPAIARRRIAAGRTSLPATAESARHAFSLILDNPALRPLIPGARIVEIGPGDHLASGLVLLACGAASYTALDRFQGDYRSASARAWYDLVRSEWPKHFATPWPAGLDDFPDVPEVQTLQLAIEEIDALPESEYDVVISVAVGEHVQDIDAFGRATLRLLRPGGVALHNIDFSSHGLFDEPDIFLNIPEWIWRLMGTNRGLPNRKRFGDFVRAFDAFKIEVVGRTTPPDATDPDNATTWASFLLRTDDGSRRRHPH